MDNDTSIKTPIRRRRYTAAFKAQVADEANQAGISVAAVAQRHGINANLVHKWRRTPDIVHPRRVNPSNFIALAPAITVPVETATAIVVELPYHATTLKIHWPADHAQALAQWVKAITA